MYVNNIACTVFYVFIQANIQLLFIRFQSFYWYAKSHKAQKSVKFSPHTKCLQSYEQKTSHTKLLSVKSYQ